MASRAKRLLVLLAALLALAVAAFLPGSEWYGAGIVVFHLLPSLLRPKLGATMRAPDGLVIVTNRLPAERTFTVARVWGAIFAALYGWVAYDAYVISPGMAQLAFLAFLLTCVAVPLLGYRLVTKRILAETVSLERATLTIQGAEGPQVLPYARIRRVERNGTTLAIFTDDERIAIHVGGKPFVAHRILGQIDEARRRAANEDAEALPELRRPSGMTMRAWLQKLDAFAAAARGPGAYRGGAIDEPALWKLLADEDADIDLRTGAARVLAAAAPPETRLRIARSAAEEDVRTRIALAAEPDLDAAVEGLETIEAQTLRKLAGV